MNIGFAGIGRMGRQLALHLARAGHQLRVYDVHAVVDDALEDLGAVQVASLDELVETSVSFSMLPDGPTAVALLTGDDGIFARAKPGHVHVALGTLGIDELRTIAADAEARGVEFADAPVSGSVAAATARTLTTMVGADHDLFERVLPLLAACTGKQFHVGAVGTGTVVKLAVNVVVGAVNQAVGEAILLATGGGVDRELFYSVLSSGAGGGAFVDYKRDAFLHPERGTVDAPVSLIAKDLALALQLAEREGLSLPGVAAAHDVAVRAVAAGLGGADLSIVTSVLNDGR